MLLHIPFDIELARELESLVTVCAFGTVKAYFRDPKSGVSQVAIVQEDYQLHEVAALFVSPPQESEVGRGEVLLLDSLESGGVVKFGVDDMKAVLSPFREYVVPLDSIDDNQLCYVLYLPPAYLVKVMDKKLDFART